MAEKEATVVSHIWQGKAKTPRFMMRMDFRCDDVERLKIIQNCIFNLLEQNWPENYKVEDADGL